MSRRKRLHTREARRADLGVVEWHQEHGIEPRGIALQRDQALARKLNVERDSTNQLPMPSRKCRRVEGVNA